jgi:transcriptional regulator with XRE-family HTH domain
MGVVASISDRVGDLGGYLREQREHARLSVRQLATLAGVSNPYLSQVERGLRKPSAEVLQQIARGLRISAEALYVRAGILDEEGRPDVEAAIHADPELTERQRRVLLDIYASFRAENRRAAEAPAAASRRRPGAERTAESTSEPAPRPAGGAADPGATGDGAESGGATGTQGAATPSRRPTTKRATPRATKRATTRSTRAARSGAAAGEPASATDGDARPGGRS